MIFGIQIYQVKTMLLHARIVTPPRYPFELSPLNEPYRGKLVRSITLIPFESF